ncbi:hypothetical protein D3C80_1460190 [compost metagenome]
MVGGPELLYRFSLNSGGIFVRFTLNLHDLLAKLNIHSEPEFVHNFLRSPLNNFYRYQMFTMLLHIAEKIFIKI